jgi:hypothetical protein
MMVKKAVVKKAIVVNETMVKKTIVVNETVVKKVIVVNETMVIKESAVATKETAVVTKPVTHRNVWPAPYGASHAVVRSSSSKSSHVTPSKSSHVLTECGTRRDRQ